MSLSNGLEYRPRLRLKGFTCPWNEIKISDVFSITRGYVLSASNVVDNSNDEYMYPVFSSQTKDKGLMGYYNDYLYENAITWTTDGANAGTVHYREGKFYCTNVCGVLLSQNGNANRCTAEILGSVSKKYVSYVGNPKLMNNVMADIKIFIPSVQEQQRIDSLIKILDQKIEKQQQLVELLKKYKKGLFDKIFEENKSIWETGKLGEYLIVQRGGSPRPIDAFLTNEENGINWIKIGDVSEDSRYITSTKEKIKPSGAKKSRPVYKGDLILSNSMSFGRPYILQIDGCIHDGWLVIRDENNIFDKEYLLQLLSSDYMYHQYKSLAAGGVVNNLNSELVQSTKILIPSFKEQKRVGNIFSIYDEKIKIANKELHELKLMKQSLLQQLFI